jgi:hypothetical protein
MSTLTLSVLLGSALGLLFVSCILFTPLTALRDFCDGVWQRMKQVPFFRERLRERAPARDPSQLSPATSCHLDVQETSGTGFGLHHTVAAQTRWVAVQRLALWPVLLLLPAVEARCLPATPSRTGNDYSWVGSGIRLNIEQNDWLGAAVSAEAGRLILEEAFGFNASITETPMVWLDSTDSPVSRIAAGTVDANFEAWKVDWSESMVSQYTKVDGTVVRSTYDTFKVYCAHDERARTFA